MSDDVFESSFFVRIGTNILHCNKLSPEDMILCGAIQSLNNGDPCIANDEAIAHLICMDKHDVSKMIKTLVLKNAIKKTEDQNMRYLTLNNDFFIGRENGK